MTTVSCEFCWPAAGNSCNEDGCNVTCSDPGCHAECTGEYCEATCLADYCSVSCEGFGCTAVSDSEAGFIDGAECFGDYCQANCSGGEECTAYCQGYNCEAANRVLGTMAMGNAICDGNLCKATCDVFNGEHCHAVCYGSECEATCSCSESYRCEADCRGDGCVSKCGADCDSHGSCTGSMCNPGDATCAYSTCEYNSTWSCSNPNHHNQFP